MKFLRGLLVILFLICGVAIINGCAGTAKGKGTSVYSNLERNEVSTPEKSAASALVTIRYPAMIHANAENLYVSSFAINAMLAGLAGGLLAHYIGFIQPSMFSIVKSTELIVMVIFGGMHSLTGAILATLALTSLPELLRAAQAWRLVVYGALVVLIMVVRPEGLMGSWELTPANVKALLSRKAQPRPAQEEG